MSGSSYVQVKVYGHDINQTNDVANDLKSKLSQIPGLRDAQLSRDDLRPEYNVVFDRDKLAYYGMNSATASQAVRNRINGLDASKYREDGDEYDIVVRYGEPFRTSIQDVENIVLYGADGQPVKLKEVATVIEEFASPSIERENRQRVIYVKASLGDGVALGTVVPQINAILDEYPLPDGMSLDLGGTVEDQGDAFGDLLTLFVLIVILVYIVMATQFESLVFPFIIMFTIPLAFTGTFLALWLTGTPLSIIALDRCDHARGYRDEERYRAGGLYQPARRTRIERLRCGSGRRQEPSASGADDVVHYHPRHVAAGARYGRGFGDLAADGYRRDRRSHLLDAADAARRAGSLLGFRQPSDSQGAAEAGRCQTSIVERINHTKNHESRICILQPGIDRPHAGDSGRSRRTRVHQMGTHDGPRVVRRRTALRNPCVAFDELFDADDRRGREGSPAARRLPQTGFADEDAGFARLRLEYRTGDVTLCRILTIRRAAPIGAALRMFPARTRDAVRTTSSVGSGGWRATRNPRCS